MNPRFKKVRLENDKKEKTIYGNFPSYYGCRDRRHLEDDFHDARLSLIRTYFHEDISSRSVATEDMTLLIESSRSLAEFENSASRCAKSFFEGKRILDVGCNAGNVSIELSLKDKAAFVLGFDIDSNLIKKARKHVNFQYSLLKPPDGVLTENPISKSEDTEKFRYFPIAMPILYGTIPINTQGGDTSEFPYNIIFKCQNWIQDYLDQQRNPYSVQGPPQKSIRLLDVILCFSVTKWVQLNWGDLGIKSLFLKVKDQLKPKGYFILESQSWESYLPSGGKFLTSDHEYHYKEIKLEPYKYSEYLQNILGFKLVVELPPPPSENLEFSRPILIFQKAAE